LNEENRLRELEEENQTLRETIRLRDEFIRKTFGSYLTDEVLEKVLTNQGDIMIKGERRVVSMLFSDLRDSTKLSEEMNAEDFIRMLNNYFAQLIEIINAWRGNIS
jgi:adenylate cyclase